MNVYVETNFILELTFMQEQYESCDKILTYCEAGRGQIILPAFCIAESYATLIHQTKKREQVANALGGEVRQLSRSQAFKHETDIFRQATALLIQSSHEEGERLVDVLDRLLRIANIIALEANIIRSSTQLRDKYSFEAQDSIVFSSVLHHLSSSNEAESCFINKNKRDFDDADLQQTLMNLRCKMLFNFDTGFNYIQKS